MAEEVEKYHKVFENILKIPIQSRSTGKSKERIEEFREQLHTTFKFWPRNAMTKISNEDDRLFLKSMMSDQKACMAGVDKKLAETEKKVRKRKAQELQRKEQLKIDETSASLSCQLEDSESNSSTDKSDVYTSENPAISHKKRMKIGTTVHIPPDILKTPTVVQSLIRNQVSSTAISSVMHDIVRAAGGEPSSLNLSYATAQR